MMIRFSTVEQIGLNISSMDINEYEYEIIILTVCSKVWSALGFAQLEHKLVGLIFFRTISNR